MLVDHSHIHLLYVDPNSGRVRIRHYAIFNWAPFRHPRSCGEIESNTAGFLNTQRRVEDPEEGLEKQGVIR
jgi:hypothetical protein